MDPCLFVRVIVESLAVKLPAVSRRAGNGVHPSTNPCFYTLTLQEYPSYAQTAPLPLAASEETITDTSQASYSENAPVVFSLDPAALQRLAGRPAGLMVSVYTGRTGSTCGISSSRLLGKVKVVLDLGTAAERPVVAQSGWVGLSGSGRSKTRLHMVVRAEPDPRFVFQFGGEPECSPVVFQIQGGDGGCGSKVSGCIRQPVFSCKFSTDRRRTTRSRSVTPESRNETIKAWFTSFGAHERDQQKEQRKGWTVTIHDLSGSPVAAASMITPFVPSPGSDRVSRSNPGAWLILRPASFSTTNWKPWGRLEAWRERGPVDALGYKFELVTDAGPNAGILIAESSVSVRKGGQFCINPSSVSDGGTSATWPADGGFVMASTVEGEGKVSKPTVQVGVHHVTCMADVALFVALSAAIDLSMDACKLFSQKLRKELCHDQQEYSL